MKPIHELIPVDLETSHYNLSRATGDDSLLFQLWQFMLTPVYVVRTDFKPARGLRFP